MDVSTRLLGIVVVFDEDLRREVHNVELYQSASALSSVEIVELVLDADELKTAVDFELLFQRTAHLLLRPVVA